MPSIDSESDTPGEPMEAACHPSGGRGPEPGGWLTPSDVAREAGVTSRTVRNWCDRDLLRCERLPSGHRRIPAHAWELFKAGAPRATQDAGPATREQMDALERRIRGASSPQEVIALLRGEK